MNSELRRKAIAEILQKSSKPVSGGELSKILSVSRQTVVGDIAELKNMGYDVVPTHTGYMINKTPFAERVFKVKHTSEETRDELNLIVDLGGTVADVYVWHKLYGKISAPLNIFGRKDVEDFLAGIKSGKSTELMHITSGYHYHTVRAENEEKLDLIDKALAEKGYLAPGN